MDPRRYHVLVRHSAALLCAIAGSNFFGYGNTIGGLAFVGVAFLLMSVKLED